MMTYKQWLAKNTFVDSGVAECTMEEAMLYFFYDGVNPLVRYTGYKWIKDDDVIARKFLYLCYSVYKTSKMGYDYNLVPPEPQHRNYQEDRDTFDYFLDTASMVDLLDNWSFRTEIVGTRFENLIKEFCYVWIDVTSGRPGAYTHKLLAEEEEEQADEDMATFSDTWSRKNWDI